MRLDSDISQSGGAAGAAVNASAGAISVLVTSDIAEIEGSWRTLEEFGIESPGQSFEFVRSWVACHRIPRDRQVYVTAYSGSRPVALMALKVTRRLFARVLSFIVGSHVGCNAPLIDTAYFASLDAPARKALWRRMLRAVPRVDAVFLSAVPDPYLGAHALFEGVGARAECETLFRAEFSSWAACDETMRNRKHRKRDRQHGRNLDALGEVSYGTAAPDEYDDVLATMFRQKALRFAALGVEDPFAEPGTATFYGRVLRDAPSFTPELFVLRVDGEIVAVRYALGRGDKLFALISSMSEDPRMQTGSPGRQEILRTVQTIFERGYGLLDIGAGASDEKRAWCNKQVTLTNHYFPRTVAGAIFTFARLLADQAKLKVKSHPAVFDFYKRLRRRKPGALRA